MSGYPVFIGGFMIKLEVHRTEFRLVQTDNAALLYLVEAGGSLKFVMVRKTVREVMDMLVGA